MNEKKQTGKNNSELLKQHLEEQFRQFRPQGEVPADMKKNVFDTLETLRLVSDVFELFTLKFTQAETDFFSQMDGGEQDGEGGGE